jgi:hypothetical protein
MSYTLYTKYFNFINFIHYINSNYYIRNWKANSILKIIFEGMKNKNEIPIVTANKQNIFFVLAELLTTVENVKKVNEKYYDVYSSYSPDVLEKKKGLIFQGNNKDSTFRAEKEPFLLAWNIHPKESQPFSTKGLEAGILNVIDFINNCTHRYSILYTFIGDIQTVLNNFRNIVDIIITTITEILDEKNTRDNLNTWVEIFYLYKSYITSESFITELAKLKEIINGDIAMLNHIIIEAWNTCHVKENFHKLDIEQAMEAENEKIETLKTKGKKSKISKKTPATSLADESKPKLIDDAKKRAASTVDTIKKGDAFAIETVKYYFFKYSVLVTDKLDEADKIYKKWDKLVLPRIAAIKSHPVLTDFLPYLTAFRNLNCKFANIKSYYEQYRILEKDIKVIDMTCQLLALPLIETNDLKDDDLLKVKDTFIAIYIIFDGIKKTIDAISSTQGIPSNMGAASGIPQAQQAQQAIQIPLPPFQAPPSGSVKLFVPPTPPQGGRRNKRNGKNIQSGGVLSDTEINDYYRRNPRERAKIVSMQTQINKIAKIIVENEKNAEEYSNTNINIGDECNRGVCDNRECDPMKYEDCRQEGQKKSEYLEMEEDIEAGMNPKEEAGKKTIRRSSKSSVSSKRMDLEGAKTGRIRQTVEIGDAIIDEEAEMGDTRMGDESIAKVTQELKKRNRQQDGGAIKLKEYKKVVLGKERCIYTKKRSKKEYIKHKGEYLTIKDFIKLKSITKQKSSKKKPVAKNKYFM